jgi:hypothetical protein
LKISQGGAPERLPSLLETDQFPFLAVRGLWRRYSTHLHRAWPATSEQKTGRRLSPTAHTVQVTKTSPAISERNVLSLSDCPLSRDAAPKRLPWANSYRFLLEAAVAMERENGPGKTGHDQENDTASPAPRNGAARGQHNLRDGAARGVSATLCLVASLRRMGPGRGRSLARLAPCDAGRTRASS